MAGPATAENLLLEIGRVVVLIAEFPAAGRLRNELRPALRSFAASPHVVFYRLKQARVEIVRVLDGRQDIEDIFAEI